MASFPNSSHFILLLLLATATATAGREIGGLGQLEAAEEEARQREADRVSDLPGQPPVNFRHYAGYVKLRPEVEEEEKALFYWFFEAEDENQNDVAPKPLALWLNGGPGCSSIAYGAAQELGPFLVQSNGQLKLNNFSWNKAANMLFLESPVGVGFSYSNKSADLHKLGDKVTAQDSYEFLLGWFKRFPNFKLHDFYLAGESYAGHYVPQLADLIHERNQNSTKDTFINLKGFMIGNAAINDETDSKGMIEYAWSHAIISDKLYHSIINECNLTPDDHDQINSSSLHCDDHLRGFLMAYSNIDIYSIYAPICLSSSSSTTSRSTLVGVAPRIFSKHEELWHKLPMGYDPCTEDYAKKYLNREEVQRALHANLTKLSYPYTSCSGVIRQWTDSTDTVLPIIHKLLNAGLRIWIYSGDTDGRVPITSTRYSINKLGLEIEEEWRAWYHKHQVAGWVETYKGGLTFASVRGAGHQVPIFAPQQSLSLFSHFLSTKILPPSRS